MKERLRRLPSHWPGAVVILGVFLYGLFLTLGKGPPSGAGMLATAAGAGWIAYKWRLRLLLNVSLLGGWPALLILSPGPDVGWMLGTGLLALNVVYFTLSLRLEWNELKFTAFAGTWLLYFLFYLKLQPDAAEGWSLAYRYALLTYIFYIAALSALIWKKRTDDGADLFLGIANAAVFGFWAFVLWERVVPIAYPMLFMGMLYVLLACLIRRWLPEFSTIVLMKLFGGILLILLASLHFLKERTLEPVTHVFIWLPAAIAMLGLGTVKRWDALRGGAAVVWLGVFGYWLFGAWTAAEADPFGNLSPFAHGNMPAWALLAAVGFYLSAKGRFERLREDDNRMLSNGFTLLSHLAVGGGLACGTHSFFAYYGLSPRPNLQLTLSAVWGLYALLLLLWGAYRKRRPLQALGSLTLICLAVKTILFDLSGSPALDKAIVFFLFAGLSAGIAYTTNLRTAPTKRTKPDNEAAPPS
ncbi:DUF2339 domain-containing protein [Paenibacillus ehimensis]|uniref:DUF2339 domain-containing protein n=1 Tax=Paenibacillus ehimensis TaxID=79264 RepID=UPI000FDB9FC6|nr:DUF2339 domain-containing protein [Paenibacillus ehimensis]